MAEVLILDEIEEELNGMFLLRNWGLRRNVSSYSLTVLFLTCMAPIVGGSIWHFKISNHITHSLGLGTLSILLINASMCHFLMSPTFFMTLGRNGLS